MVILHQMFSIFLSLMFFESANALECPIDKTCDSFWKHLLKYPGHNLKKALKCLEYDENISPMEALGNKSFPQEIFIDVLDMNVLEINQERQYGIWGYKLRFNWYDHRIEWPMECQNNKSQTNLHTLRSDLLDLLWNPIAIFQEVAGRNFGQRQPSYEKSISIGQVKLLLALLDNAHC